MYSFVAYFLNNIYLIFQIKSPIGRPQSNDWYHSGYIQYIYTIYMVHMKNHKSNSGYKLL